MVYSFIYQSTTPLPIINETISITKTGDYLVSWCECGGNWPTISSTGTRKYYKTGYSSADRHYLYYVYHCNSGDTISLSKQAGNMSSCQISVYYLWPYNSSFTERYVFMNKQHTNTTITQTPNNGENILFTASANNDLTAACNILSIDIITIGHNEMKSIIAYFTRSSFSYSFNNSPQSMMGIAFTIT